MQTDSVHALEALDRAEHGLSMTNYPAIFAGFMAKGIAESDIRPRENVFTFNAWKAKGRVVRNGEHGVKVITFVPITDKETGEVTGKRPWTSTVFHISQTQAFGESDTISPKQPTPQQSTASHARHKQPATRQWIEA